MYELQHFLEKVISIVQKDRIERAERRKRGELFNIFSILNLRTYEVRTHSAFIAELLNPHGSHGLGDKFLKAFISAMPETNDWEFDTAHASVTVEDRSAGTINELQTEGGRIDIVIRSDDKIIMIENKIYANDQYKQLVRYDSYGKQFSRSALFYLTLDGSEASDISCKNNNGKKIPYIPIGYNHEISEWLNRCLQIAAQYPLVRETIVQYINLIKELTNQMDNIENKNLLLEIMTHNIEATSAIYNIPQSEYMTYLLNKYLLPQLASIAKKLGLEFGYSDNLFNACKESGFYFYKAEWISGAIMFWTETTNWRNFFCGISNRTAGKLDIASQQKLDCMNNAPTDYWPYGWTKLTDKYKNWTAAIMPDIVNGQFACYIEQTIMTILQEIDSKSIKIG